MDEPKYWAVGDACPACGGELEPAPVMTAEQEKARFDRENPVIVPAAFDSAPAAVRKKLGVLHCCGRCRYQARVDTRAA